MRHAIKVALFMLAGVAAFLVYGFTDQVAPMGIAILSAGSLVLTYIGLAFAEIPQRQQHNARRVAWAAMIVEALYGTLYVLSHYYPAFFAAPPWYAAIPLAALHGASFSTLAFFVSLFIFHERQRAMPAHAPADPEDTVKLLVDALKQIGSVPPQPVYPRPELVDTGALQAAPKATRATRIYACPSCGHTLTQGQYGAAVKYGRCQNCPPSLSSGQDAG
jgi:hypothetical protein